MNIAKQKTNTPHQTGFTLLEVLIAMLILAIGVLGVAALQLKGYQYNIDAGFRGNLSVLTYDIVDRMRLNSSAAANYVSAYTVPSTAPSGCTHTSAATAANDLSCWQLQLYRLLPPTTIVTIAAVSGSTNAYTVDYRWKDRQGNDHQTYYSFQI